MDKKVLQKSLDKAKVALMGKPDTIFFTTVLFGLKFSWNEAIPTARTNGIELEINPHFWASRPAEQHPLILLHETGHVIFHHCLPSRIGKRNNPDKWNEAGDYVINGMYAKRGWKIPDGWLYNPSFEGLSTEQVYDRLPDSPAQGDNGQGMRDVVIGNMPGKTPPQQGEGPSQPGQQPSQGGMTPQQIEEKINEIIVRAALQSQIGGDKPGTIPGEVEIFLEKLKSPKLPWTTILRRFLNDRIKEDYSWRKPNRRFFPEHHLPSQDSEGLGHLAFAVDTSGSVSNADFNTFISELAGVLKQFRPKRMTLIQFDTSIKSINEIRCVSDLMRVKFHGRGGTCVFEVMQWAEQNKPMAMLVFTDGGFRQIDIQLSKTALIWLIHDNPQWRGRQGKTINYEMEH
jgi:predicted metal-dependent peptidase